jgi:glycosyltransferase involved in cell wall biosynthesis
MMSYALVMIVKNAAGDLPRTLAAARPFISHWTICDTGSTDNTMEIVRRELACGGLDPDDGEAMDASHAWKGPFLSKCACGAVRQPRDTGVTPFPSGCPVGEVGAYCPLSTPAVPGDLFEDEWVNFGHNRSLAFARAKDTADWLLLLDADMAVNIAEGFQPDPKFDAYMVEMGGHTSFSYRLPLLVRGDIPWKSVGRVHEYTTRADGLGYTTEPTDAVTVDMLAIDRSSPEKFKMHAAFLEESLAEDPTNTRDTYYLGQTYSCLGDPRARELFLKRVSMGGYPAEVWYSAFRAACLAPTWEESQRELIAAYELRPWRMEPLVALAQGYNRNDQHHIAYLLTGIIPPPNPDALFVHTDCWRWGLKFERAISAWWVGAKAEARVLCDELLADPDLPANVREQVIRNREFS